MRDDLGRGGEAKREDILSIVAVDVDNVRALIHAVLVFGVSVGEGPADKIFFRAEAGARAPSDPALGRAGVNEVPEPVAIEVREDNALGFGAEPEAGLRIFMGLVVK